VVLNTKTNQKNIMKKIIALIASALLAAPLAMAQVETGTSAGAQALDRARSAPISAGRAPTTVTVTDYKTAGGKDIVVIEEEDKWWSVNASTGWDSLYMFRGVNVLGNGNGLYWLGADVGVSPWSGGTITAGVWYGVGSWYNGANSQTRYGELDIFADFTQQFGNLAVSVGWILYWYPNGTWENANGDAFYGTAQNEIYFGLGYDIEVGSVTITPNTTYYYNLGPELGSPGGAINGGSSYWTFGVDLNIPVAYDGAVALEPYSVFGVNFGFNDRYSDGAFNRFRGGNNWETGIALAVQFTSWFSVAPYVAYSYQWQDLPSFGYSPDGDLTTAVNTWWAGVSANFSF
jgi:hypothetical protein